MNITEDQLRDMQARMRGNFETEAPVPEVAASDDDRPESLIQEECVKFMQEDGWRALRTDPVSDKSRAKGFGEVGMADYLFLRQPHPHVSFDQILWVEFKSRKGCPSKHQTAWHAMERARGFRTWIASVDFPASVDGFRAHYEASGLMRRTRWW